MNNATRRKEVFAAAGRRCDHPTPPCSQDVSQNISPTTTSVEGRAASSPAWALVPQPQGLLLDIARVTDALLDDGNRSLVAQASLQARRVSLVGHTLDMQQSLDAALWQLILRLAPHTTLLPDRPPAAVPATTSLAQGLGASA